MTTKPLLSGMITAACFAVGCGQAAKTPAPAEIGAHGHEHESAAEHAAHGHSHAGHTHAGHTHDAWWCDEHGVPEEICGLCNSKLAAEFQKKGDWCQEHDRPDSQCFACHPELEARFAAQYEAKYGRKPPKPQM